MKKLVIFTILLVYSLSSTLCVYSAQPNIPNIVAGDLDGDGEVTLTDYALMKDYISGKIKQFPIDLKILSADSLSYTINKGDKFELPKSVTATMYLNGQKRNLPVVWNKLDIDTNIIGQYVIKGTVDNYQDNIILKLTIVENEIGNTNSNITNSGLSVQKGDWIYYSSKNSKEYGLYKVKIDGTGKTKILSKSVESINVVGDWVYFVENFAKGIFKVKTDGTQLTQITKDRASSINVQGAWIYYQTISMLSENSFTPHGELCRIDTNGINKTILVSKSGCYCITDGWIYFINNTGSGKLAKMRTDGTDFKLLTDKQVWQFDIQGDWIYYIDTNDYSRLHKMKKDGTEDTLLYDKKVANMNVTANFIYFTEQTGESLDVGILYKMKLDGTRIEKIYNEPLRFLNVSGDWIFVQIILGDYSYYRIRIDGSTKEKL